MTETADPDGTAQLTRPTDASDEERSISTRSRAESHAHWVAWAAVLGVTAFIVLTMGASLVGLRTFTATDLLSAYQPWRAQQGQDWSLTGARFSDHVNSILPNTSEFVDRLRDGDIAWWSPYNNGGAPLASIDEGAVFSPMTWPYFVLPLWLAPVWSHLLVMLTTISGMVLFLRRLGVSRAAGVVAGFAFATSGFMYLNVLWPHTKVVAFLPWMFWAVERAVQRRHVSSVVPIALVTTLLYVGGFPAVAAFVLGAGVLYGGLRLVQRRRHGLGTGEAVRVGGLALAAIVLGLGLVAWLILPFNNYIGGIDLGYRQQTTECHAPEKSLASLIFPRYGSAARFGFECPTGEHETDGFAGAMIVGLAALGSLAPGRHRRTLRTFFVAIGAVSAMLAYFGGPLLWVVQRLPVFEDNRIMRIRVLMSFAIAILAAFGLDRLRAELRHPEHRRTLAWVAALMGVAALAAARMHTWPDIPAPPFGGWVPFVACLMAGAVFLAARAPGTRLRLGAVVLVPLLVGAEAVAAIGPYWPTGDPDDLYPETTTTDFLMDNLGSDRFAASERTLMPNANLVYGLRSVTGRSFYEDEWNDLIKALNEGVSESPSGTRTTSILEHLPVERVASPVFDRLAVRYYVEDSRYTYGVRDETGELTRPDELRPDEPVVIPVDGPIRGVGFWLMESPGVGGGSPRVDVGGDRPRVEVELIDADGDVVGRGSQRIYRGMWAGNWHVPVAGDAAVDAVGARITLVDADHPLEVGANDAGLVAYTLLPTDDGLQLVHADGTVIYERDSAAPRMRWASDAIVETDAARRVDLVMDASVPVSTVVLSEPGPRASGEPAAVDVVDDGGDYLQATVDAEGDGYLVVADAIQRGWRARLDGEPVELRAADHAVVAVAVPAGRHDVEFIYERPGQRTGAYIAAVSALVLAAMALTALRHRSSTGDARSNGSSPS